MQATHVEDDAIARQGSAVRVAADAGRRRLCMGRHRAGGWSGECGSGDCGRLRWHSRAQGAVLDQVVAVVNGDLVLESDVDEERRFAAFQPLHGPGRDVFADEGDRAADRRDADSAAG